MLATRRKSLHPAGVVAVLAVLVITPFMVGGCTGGGSSQSSVAVYDPAKDPLVNVPEMFEPPPSDRAKTRSDETVVQTLDGNPATLNPLFQSSTYEFRTMNSLFVSLFEWDRAMIWRVNKSMVESFEESDDHKTYTVKLRPGLTWQDGHPITAHDVVFSWTNILDERVPCPSLRTGAEDVIECKALNNLTVVMKHREAYATNTWNAYFPIVPKHLYEKDKEANPDLKTGTYYSELNRNPVGNGPYKFVRWLDDDKIELERWEDYFGPKPYFKRKIYRIIPERNIQLLNFCKGNVDELELEPIQFATQTGPDSEFGRMGRKVLKPRWLHRYICWNMDGSNPYFSDKKVRHAMTHALDLPRNIRDMEYNLVTQATGVFHPTSPWFNPDVKALEFDLDRASALLDEAGWTIDEERGGFRHKVLDGEPVKFTFTLMIPQGASSSVNLAAMYQADLRSIGVDMQTQIMEWATFSERNRKHEFQAFIAGWGTGTDPDTLRNIWQSTEWVADGTHGRNYGKFQNARVDELFELARNEFDFEKRRKLYQEVQKLIYEEQPYTWCYYRSTIWGVNKGYRGITNGPRGLFNYEPADNAWWVPATP